MRAARPTSFLFGAFLLGALSSSIATPAFAADAAEESPPPDASASAPAPGSRGLQLGARFGYSLPIGTIADSLPTHVSDLETASVPIGLDAGYRFTRFLYAGGSLAWGAGVSPNSQKTCPQPASCFRQDTQLRADARLYFNPGAQVSWWMAWDVGWELAAFSRTYQGATVTSTFTGPLLTDIQLGFDSHNGLVAVGPYLGVAVAEFLTEGINPSAAPVSTWLAGPGVHAWVTLGLRGSYGPW